jgi:hypothetical protein
LFHEAPKRRDRLAGIIGLRNLAAAFFLGNWFPQGSQSGTPCSHEKIFVTLKQKGWPWD